MSWLLDVSAGAEKDAKSAKKKKKSKPETTSQILPKSIDEIQAKLAENEAQQQTLRKNLRALKKQKIAKTGTAPESLDLPSQNKKETEGTQNQQKDTQSDKKEAKEANGQLNHAQKKALARKQFKAAKRAEILETRYKARKAKRDSDKPNPGTAKLDSKLGKRAKNAEPSISHQSREAEIDTDLKSQNTKESSEEDVQRKPQIERGSSLDMSAWQNLCLDSRVLNAIAALKFLEPTPIQRECLPSAIRDRRDIIGAAQTVSSTSLPHLRANQDSLWNLFHFFFNSIKYRMFHAHFLSASSPLWPGLVRRRQIMAKTSKNLACSTRLQPFSKQIFRWVSYRLDQSADWVLFSLGNLSNFRHSILLF